MELIHIFLVEQNIHRHLPYNSCFYCSLTYLDQVQSSTCVCTVHICLYDRHEVDTHAQLPVY